MSSFDFLFLNLMAFAWQLNVFSQVQGKNNSLPLTCPVAYRPDIEWMNLMSSHYSDWMSSDATEPDFKCFFMWIDVIYSPWSIFVTLFMFLCFSQVIIWEGLSCPQISIVSGQDR